MAMSDECFGIKWVFFLLSKFDEDKSICKKERRWQGFASPEGCPGDRVWVAANHLCRGYIALLCEAPVISVWNPVESGVQDVCWLAFGCAFITPEPVKCHACSKSMLCSGAPCTLLSVPGRYEIEYWILRKFFFTISLFSMKLLKFFEFICINTFRNLNLQIPHSDT